MTDRNLDKALDIVSNLIMGREVSRQGENSTLYEEYENNSQVYELVGEVLKKLNINVFEYNYGLYTSPGENNKVFGYTNEELRKILGLKLNRELYLCYFIIYNIITRFYNDSGSYTYVEYVKKEDIISGVDASLSGIIKDIEILSVDEVEADSFKELALLWEDMPVVSGEDIAVRASRGSKAGYVKLVLNFLVQEELLAESMGRYYPRDRFRAVVENYFETYKGRLYEIFRGDNEDATY